ncbi:MAG: hypothetical protein S4CHLAM2_07680 [Chlamydiales bacterium]|nr:hypothetical protein [Chlamydiales bacterium]
MNTSLKSYQVKSWDAVFPSDLQDQVIESLEAGKVIYFPTLGFPLSQQEQVLLRPDLIAPKSKNISYDLNRARVGGAACATDEEAEALKTLIHRFARSATAFLDRLAPHYQGTLVPGKTSLRPVEIQGRQSSYRKDDTRLHVDAFPSNPMKGKRILRFFTNINPEGKTRRWRVGEPFETVSERFASQLAKPNPLLARLYQMLKITKDLRTPYDHYMLQLHDKMKGDMTYQKNAWQETIDFPPGSSWMCFTDQVSHSALSGQHVLEQTFYLPGHGLKHPEFSPLAILEKRTGRTLLKRN